MKSEHTMKSVVVLLLTILPPLISGKKCSAGNAICLPDNYSKQELPLKGQQNRVEIGTELEEISKIDDKSHSISMLAKLTVLWKDPRININEERMNQDKGQNPNDAWITVDAGFSQEIWLPEIEIMDVKEFVKLPKMEGLWVNPQKEVLYSMKARITFRCRMNFEDFPLDTQKCQFQAGSLSSGLDARKVLHEDYFIPDLSRTLAISDYDIKIRHLPPRHKSYLTREGNFTLAGFEMVMERKSARYILSYYLPSGILVLLSWISFVTPPERVTGRLLPLLTVFLVLINMSGSIMTNSPKTHYVTAIELWMIISIFLVFLALLEYACLLLKFKIGSLFGSGSENQNNDSAKSAWLKKAEIKTNGKIDLLFLFICFLLFLIFNVAYWSYFLQEDYEPTGAITISH